MQVRVRVQLPLDDDGVRRLDRARLLLRAGHPVLCEVIGSPVLADVDVLARLALLARRQQLPLEIRTDRPCAELCALVGLTGALLGQVGGQAEAGEQRRVQEVVHVHELPG